MSELLEQPLKAFDPVNCEQKLTKSSYKFIRSNSLTKRKVKFKRKYKEVNIHELLCISEGRSASLDSILMPIQIAI